jgi:hypothetical protein
MNWSAERVLWICEITSISAGVLAVVAACLTEAALVGQESAGPIVNQTTELLQLKADVAQQQARAASADARLPHAEAMPTTGIATWLSTRVEKPKGRVNQYYCDAVLWSKLLFELSTM